MVDVAYLKELAAPLGGVTMRRMFGGLCLWHEGLAFALVIDDRLFFKVDAVNGPDYDTRGLPRFSYTTRTGRTTVMSYARAPEEIWDEPELFLDWARGAIAAARRVAAEKPVPRPRRRKAT